MCKNICEESKIPLLNLNAFTWGKAFRNFLVAELLMSTQQIDLFHF